MRTPPKRSFNPGEREVVVLVFAFVALALGAFIFVVGFSRFQSRSAEADTTTPTSVAAAPQDGVVTPDPNLETTAEIAPTIAPTVSQVLHTVAEGETLTGIAILYGVDLQTILDANTLTADSIVIPGQQLVVPLYPTDDGLWHTVQAGETLTTIAAQYGLTTEDLLQANALANPDTLFSGQRIFVPVAVGEGAPPADGATPTVSTAEGLPPGGPQLSNWARSIHEGELDVNYPLTTEQARFTVHYQPGTYAEEHLTDVVQLINNALSLVEGRLEVSLQGTFDVYVAGTLFEAPDASLRGRSRSLDRRLFFLYDGSGTPADNLYLVTHELTHMVSWNTWGSPSSVMLSEGLATWTGQGVLEQNGFLPYDQLCVGAYSVGAMESMAAIEVDFQSFLGHNQDRFNYFGAGCFVGYLIDTYSLGPMSRLYHTSDYSGLYGQSLTQLDAAWQAELEKATPTLTTNALDLVAYNDEWLNAANYVFRNYNGSTTMHQGYYALDLARVSLWKADYVETRHWLDEVYRITGYTP